MTGQGEQTVLFLDGLNTHYPVARNTDPETSHEAAASVTRIRETQKVVLDYLRRYGPMTDEQIWQLVEDQTHGLRFSPSGVRTRRSELVALGLVKDTGERRRLNSGRRAIVWRVAA